MTADTLRTDEEGANPTEELFRDAERRLDGSFAEAQPALSRNCILWTDQSKRTRGCGSFSQELKWHRTLTRYWNDSAGATCIILELFAHEPWEISWGVPLHWCTTVLSEPRILPDARAQQRGNSKFEDVLFDGLEQFILLRMKQEASRVGREL